MLTQVSSQFPKCQEFRKTTAKYTRSQMNCKLTSEQIRVDVSSNSCHWLLYESVVPDVQAISVKNVTSSGVI